MRIFAYTFSVFCLCACSGGFGTMDGIMRSWEGQPLDAVIAQWGFPDEERTVAGHKLYVWHYTKSAIVPSTTTGTVSAVGNTAYINSYTSPGGVIAGNCMRTLEVDDRNIVTRWQWQGNNCPFADVMEYSSWRRKS